MLRKNILLVSSKKTILNTLPGGATSLQQGKRSGVLGIMSTSLAVALLTRGIPSCLLRCVNDYTLQYAYLSCGFVLLLDDMFSISSLVLM